MNDLDLIAGLAGDAPLLSPPDLAGPRARLTEAITAERARANRTSPGSRPATRVPAGPAAGFPAVGSLAGRRRGPRGGGRGKRRVLAAVAGATGISAAAAVAVAVALPADGPGSPRPRTSPVSAPVAVLPAHLTAVDVLNRAAAAALGQPAVVPAAGQYVYIKDLQGKQTEQMWLSVDGRHDNLYEWEGWPPSTTPGCPADGRATISLAILAGGERLTEAGPRFTKAQLKFMAARGVAGVKHGTWRCTLQPAFLPGMPTKASAMGAWLAANQFATPANLNNLAKTVGELLETTYLLPGQRAALYQYLGTVPGLTLVRDTKDSSGRPGVGVEWTFHGYRSVLIFNPATFAYLGWTSLGVNGQEGSDAILQTAIVDKPGELPPS